MNGYKAVVRRNRQKQAAILLTALARTYDEILAKIQSGLHVRMADGRCGDSFVDVSTVYQLEKDGKVVLFTNKGVTFARATTDTESVK